MNVLLISLQEGLDVVGLKYLHYYLRENGHRSFLLHLPSFEVGDERALEHIGRFVSEVEPGFIGVGLMSVEYFRARELTQYLKQNFASIPVIWGGVHPTIAPETCLDDADYVCVGEGERTILDFANAIERNEDVRGINNLCYRENGEIRRNPLYPYIEDLDEVPSYDHIATNGFLQVGNGHIVSLTPEVFRRHARYNGVFYSVMSTRGCPFSCTYCCNNFFARLYETKRLRRRSVAHVIAELEKAVRDNPWLEYINFQDDCFLARGEASLAEFCALYKERVGKPFVVRSIPTYITREKTKALKDAGLAWINLGLQSGSDRVVEEVYKRKSKQADFLEAAHIIREFEVAAFYDVILDNPFEYEEDHLETVKTLIKAPKPFYTQFFSLSLYLGTELYERAREECPEQMEDSRRKQILVYNRSVINNLVRLATFLDEKWMNRIVDLYRQDPAGLWLKINLSVANLLSFILFEPLTYFRVIRLSQNGSSLKALKVLPDYFAEGFKRYWGTTSRRSTKQVTG